MSRERRLLLGLLVAAAFSCVFGSLLYAQLDRLRSVEHMIGVIGRQYARIGATSPTDPVEEKIQELGRTEEAELSRCYGSGEMDLYRFGSIVNGMLARHGISVRQFRTMPEAATPALELSASGTPSAFMMFLSDVSAQPKYWTVPYLHLRSPEGGGTVTCELRIGYRINDRAK